MLLRISLLILAVVFPIAANAEGAPTSPEKLAAGVVAAIKSGDFSGYQKLMPDEALLRKMCPMVKKSWKEYVDEAREWFGKCRERGDWSKARIVEVKGGSVDAKNREQACPSVSMADNVKFEVSLGKDSTKVKLDNPMVFDGKYYILAPPTCR